MLIASCTSIIRRLTARQDDGRAVTVSVIPLHCLPAAKRWGTNSFPSQMGFLDFFILILRWAATSQQLARKRAPAGMIWTPHLVRDWAMTTRTHTQRPTNITGQWFVLFQVTFKAFPAGDWAKVFYAANTWHQGANQPEQHFSEDGPWSVPLWPATNCPSPTANVAMGCKTQEGNSEPSGARSCSSEVSQSLEKARKRDRGGRCYSHTCFSPLLKKPQGILQDPGALAQVGVGN